MDDSWVCSCSICFRNSHRPIDPKIPEHERVVESILYNLLGWKHNKWNTAWLHSSLREKRLSLTYSCQTAQGLSTTETLLGDKRGRQDLPALPCVSLKGDVAHLQKQMCRAEGKSIQTLWRTARHEGNWAGIKFFFCFSACHYVSFLVLLQRKKADLQLSWSMCKTLNSGVFLRQQSTWIMRTSTALAALIQSHYKVHWIPTKISHYSLCPHQGTLLSNSLACDF